MKVAQVIAGVANQAAGTSYSVVRLAQELAKLGMEVEVHTPGPEPCERASGVRYRFYRCFDLTRGAILCPTMKRKLTRAVADVDVVHSQGFWLAPNLHACVAAQHHGRPLVLSPRGMFSTWTMAHKPWKYAAARAVGYLRKLGAVTCFHATSESEAKDIRRLGFRQPIAVVPNGIDLPDISDIRTPEQPQQERQRRVVFLSRIHPVKGIPTLLRAWQHIEAEFPEWELIVAGPDEGGYLREVQALTAGLGLHRVSFPGPAYGEAKTRLLRSADLFVLPTHSENFGFAIGEALAHAVPVITTTGAPWPGLLEHGCGWWIELSEDNLIGAMREAATLARGRLVMMGVAARRYVEACYAWEAVGRATAEVYKWLVTHERKPSFIRLD
jgi:glycosyltransferase involved in cell wall biosynthesis